MTEFFVPEAMTVKLPTSGRTVRFGRGIQVIPAELADHGLANKLGIKPVEEMTDADYRSIGLKRPPPTPAPAAEPVPEIDHDERDLAH